MSCILAINLQHRFLGLSFAVAFDSYMPRVIPSLTEMLSGRVPADTETRDPSYVVVIVVVIGVFIFAFVATASSFSLPSSTSSS
jgi:hypothetical protein